MYMFFLCYKLKFDLNIVGPMSDLCEFLAAFSRIGSIREKPRMNSSSATLDTAAMLHQNGGVSERSELLHNSVQGLKRVALYVLGEKAQMKVRACGKLEICDVFRHDRN
jgi:hypothetical protein